MLLNYLKFSLRLVTRNPFFTLINVTGLSVGFATRLPLSLILHTNYSPINIKTGRQWRILETWS